jgi:adenylylsulfate kinase
LRVFKAVHARITIRVNEQEAQMSVKTGWCVWITGLPGSGKSVVSKALLKLLNETGVNAQLLSSDALRKILTPKPCYSLEERNAVYATLVYIAGLLTKNGVNVIIDATGNLRRYRDNARQQIGKFVEVYLQCPLEICMKREAKRKETHQAPEQIYARAKQGKAPTVPGVGQPYEPPLKPELAVDTTHDSPEQVAEKILEYLKNTCK